MSFISQDILSFKGGVSQQPPIIRYPDQLEEQIKAEDPKKWEEFKREMIRIYGSLEY